MKPLLDQSRPSLTKTSIGAVDLQETGLLLDEGGEEEGLDEGFTVVIPEGNSQEEKKSDAIMVLAMIYFMVFFVCLTLPYLELR